MKQPHENKELIDRDRDATDYNEVENDWCYRCDTIDPETGEGKLRCRWCHADVRSDSCDCCPWTGKAGGPFYDDSSPLRHGTQRCGNDDEGTGFLCDFCEKEKSGLRKVRRSLIQRRQQRRRRR